MADLSASAVLQAVATHEKGEDLARLVHAAAFAAADERRPRLDDGLTELADRHGISREGAETPYGNVLRALERGGAEAAGSATRALLGALLARGVALSPPDGAEAEARVAESLLWLSTHTSVDALSFIDEALGAKADGLWLAVAALVRRVDAGNAPLVGRAGALLGVAALRASASKVARDEIKALATELRDPIARALASEPEAKSAAKMLDIGPDSVVTGELTSAPRHPVTLVLLGLTGVLAAVHLARLFGRYALGYRRPAELRINARGVVIASKTEMLGRTLTTREARVPLEALATATREIKFPRAAMYAGLIALALGSYLGVSLFVDGARAGSPELLGVGLLLVLIGVALDFALESARGSSKGRCRVIVVPRNGRAIAMTDLDPTLADTALRRLG
jgi:hypothetical protein